jgi:hypothetical protein
MAENIVGGLFGVMPEDLAAQRMAAIDQQAQAFGRMSGREANRALGYKAGAVLGQGLFGIQDPQMERVRQRQEMAQGIDFNDPESLLQAAQAANQAGDTQAAQALYSKAVEAQQSQATLRKTQAQAAQEQFNLDKQQRLEAALAALPPNATDQDKLNIITQFGGADKLLTVIQGKQNIEQQIAARKEAADREIQARKEAAIQAHLDKMEVLRQQGATQFQINAANIQGRKDLAELMASMKPPSSAVLKAQADADAKAAGQEVLANTLDTAKTLITDLSKAEGMTGTSRSALANLFTSLSTTGVGQTAGRMVGTATQSKRDELASVRLQLLNAIKEATGIASSQLNSNVELQTWLSSLGSAGMTKEANEAILSNLENSYLKKKKGVNTLSDADLLNKYK